MTARPNAPLVTVAIPTRNRSTYVERAIRTVLAQTFSDFELIVSDNASHDDTVERLRAVTDARLVLLTQDGDLGMAGNWNACLAAARGTYFLLLSDDDYLAPSAVQRLLEPFLCDGAGVTGRSIALTWCPARLVDENDRDRWQTLGGPGIEAGSDFLAGMFKGSRGPRFCGIMVRTADARAVGGYNAAQSPICDIGNWGAIALRYDFVACVCEPLVTYTMHFGSTSSKTTCSMWKRAGERVFADLMPLVKGRDARAYRQLRRARTPFIAGLIATVIMQSAGKAGWTVRAALESLRAARYMFAPSTVYRLVTNVAKLRSLSGE